MARTQIGGRRTKRNISTHKMQIRRGDRVKVIRGNYAGTEGTVLRVLPQENRVVVEGVNQRKRHMRPTQENPEGGIVTFEAPIHASNVMLIDPATGEPSRVRSRRDAEGTRERISTRSGNPVPKTNK
jgi:large subunit ribosomal protein L24